MTFPEPTQWNGDDDRPMPRSNGKRQFDYVKQFNDYNNQKKATDDDSARGTTNQLSDRVGSDSGRPIEAE